MTDTRAIGGQGITSQPAGKTVQPIITVFGATGTQGGSVVRHVLDAGTYKVRGVTRNVNSPSAAALRDLGAEPVKADFHDEELIKHAVAGSTAVFALTNSWDPQIGHKEVELGTRLAKIAKDAGVQIFIWAGLPNVERISSGKLDVPHFSNKAKVWEEIKKLGFPVAVSLEAAFYFSNFDGNPVMSFTKGDDGAAVFKFPILSADQKVAGFDTNDLGAPVGPILQNPQRFDKKRVVFASANNLPVSAFSDTFTKLTGVKATLTTIPAEAVAANSKELADMLIFFREYGYYGGETGNPDVVDASDVVSTPLTTFEQWLAKSKIPGQFK